MTSHGSFTFTSDRSHIDLDAAYELLVGTHWAGTLSRDVLQRAAANSLCFGVHQGDRLVGFARVITDLATFAYLTDVVVHEEFRRQGLGQWFMERILDSPDLKGLRRITLLTRNAETLYRRLGFERGSSPLVYMERRTKR